MMTKAKAGVAAEMVRVEGGVGSGESVVLAKRTNESEPIPTETPSVSLDDRTPVEKKADDESDDLYSLKNFSL